MANASWRFLIGTYRSYIASLNAESILRDIIKLSTEIKFFVLK